MERASRDAPPWRLGHVTRAGLCGTSTGRLCGDGRFTQSTRKKLVIYFFNRRSLRRSCAVLAFSSICNPTTPCFLASVEFFPKFRHRIRSRASVCDRAFLQRWRICVVFFDCSRDQVPSPRRSPSSGLCLSLSCSLHFRGLVRYFLHCFGLSIDERFSGVRLCFFVFTPHCGLPSSSTGYPRSSMVVCSSLKISLTSLTVFFFGGRTAVARETSSTELSGRSMTTVFSSVLMPLNRSSATGARLCRWFLALFHSTRRKMSSPSDTTKVFLCKRFS